MSLVREYAQPDTFCYICERDLFNRERFSQIEKTKESKEQHDSEQNTNVMRFKR